MERTARAIEIVAAIIMAMVAIFICIGVIGRKVFDYNVPDAFDLSKHLQGIAIAWGIAMATYYKSHVVVDVLWEVAGKTGRKLIDGFATVFVIGCMAVFAYAFVDAFWPVVTSKRTTNELKIPIWVFFGIIAVGIVVAFILSIVGAVKPPRTTDSVDTAPPAQ
jgi:TRAP-type transport system small permease protein